MSDRHCPNIVLIMSDEHDPAVMGCAGDRLGTTPNLDRLAAEGVRFDAAYTTCPVCSPARLSVVAGQYVSRCGAWNNQCMLPSDDYPSLAHLLNAAGVPSSLCGKMHFAAGRRYGFTELFPYRGNSKPKSGKVGFGAAPDRAPNREQWRQRAATFTVIPDDVPFRQDPTVSECDAFITEQAVAFLRTHRADSAPFFLTIGYHAPHFPLTVPQRWHERFAGRVPPPIDFEGRQANAIPNYRARNAIHGVTSDISPDEVQRGRECYWALTAWLDNEIGTVLAELERLGMAENTLVIYTSDHGENKGDHGMWWKLCMYEPAVRIPLIVRWPQRVAAGQVRAGCCSLVDLSATLLNVAGVPQPADWDGASLLPVIDDPAHPWRDFAVSQILGCGTAGSVMLRRRNLKYVYHLPYAGDQPHRELYDMARDPQELANLADTPGYAEVMDAMHRQLVDIVGEPPESSDARARHQDSRAF